MVGLVEVTERGSYQLAEAQMAEAGGSLRQSSRDETSSATPMIFIVTPMHNMAGKFVQLKLQEDQHSSIPLVLQSEYQWNKITGVVVKRDAGNGGSHDNTELQLIPEALELLKTIQKPVAVLAICGPYRSGKSFFMSRVIGQQDTFKLGHSMEVCTRGIWLSTRALECDEFVLLLLDTEGIGAVEGEGPESITTKLLVSTILLSSFLIYNSTEVPKQADLQQMRCVYTL